jgi:hypothetical protein
MTHRRDGERIVDVEAGLEALIFDVESAVVAYLVRITEETRAVLATAIAAVDAESSASDAFRARRGTIATSGSLAGLGTSSLDVIGQTSRYPIVNEVPLKLFQAQVALVRAARTEVAAATPLTLDALAGANRDLADVRRDLHGDASELPDPDATSSAPD